MNIKEISADSGSCPGGYRIGIYFDVFRYWNGDKSKIEGSGTIEVTEIEISSKVAGRVASLPADEGRKVKQGDLLVNLHYDELSAQQSSAMANLSYAEQNLTKAAAIQEKSCSGR